MTRDDITPIAQSDESRTFWLTAEIVGPVTDDEANFVIEAPWPFDVLSVWYFTEGGTVDFRLLIDSTGVVFDTSDGSGLIVANTGSKVQGVAQSDFSAVDSSVMTLSIPNSATASTKITVQVQCKRVFEPSIIQLSPFLDTFTDSAQAGIVKGDPGTGGPAENLIFTKTVASIAYIHLEFDLSAYTNLAEASLHFHVKDPTLLDIPNGHPWEIQRMDPQVIELQSSHNNINQGSSTPWPTGGADGGLADAVALAPPITGTVPDDLVLDQDYRFSNVIALALDAIVNRSGSMKVFIYQTGSNGTLNSAAAFYSSRNGLLLEPKLWIRV